MFPKLTPITKVIVIINVVLFLLTLLLENQGINLVQLLAAYYPKSLNFRSWQIITHMFMHGGWGHLIFNMFTLVSFGPIIEQTLGSKKYLSFYFLCGLGSLVLYLLWVYFNVHQVTASILAEGINPAPIYEHSNIFAVTNNYVNALDPESRRLFFLISTPMLGASGAIFGVMTAFAVLFPNAKLVFMFIPFPIKAKYLMPLIILGSLFLGVSQFQGDNVAHFAHLGGALVGYLWIKNWKKTQHRIS